jgi:hypothetical protein
MITGLCLEGEESNPEDVWDVKVHQYTLAGAVSGLHVVSTRIASIGASHRQNGTTAWTAIDDVSFRLSSEVPEPATLSLVAIAILCFARRGPMRRSAWPRFPPAQFDTGPRK